MFYAVSEYGEALPLLRQTVVFDLEEATLAQALKEIARQTGLDLSYNPAQVQNGKRISMRMKDSAAEALQAVLADAGLEALLSRKREIVVVEKEEPKPAPEPQTGTITGTVTDAQTGETLPGASVLLEGTGRGASTDAEGQFRIEDVEAASYDVTASFVGYEEATEEVDVVPGDTLTVDFALQPGVSGLDEVIVAGTVTETRRRESPVPVAVLSEEEIQTPSRTRIDQLFRGGIPGIIGLEESPTQRGAFMFVRGRSSLDVNDLVKVYVDGVELPSTALLSTINMQNVERVELLRGPQASTIYGSDAAAGVLLVFTKDGYRGGPRLSGSASIGRMASEFVDDNPITTENQLNVSGGAEGFTYSVGGSYNSTGEWIEQGDSRKVGFTGQAKLIQGPLRFSLTSMYTNRLIGSTNPPGAAVLAPVIPSFGVPLNTDVTTTLQLLGASATYAPSERWETTLNLGWNGITNRFEQYEPQAIPSDSTFNRRLQTFDQLSARLHSTLKLKPASNVSSTTTAGAELSRSNNEFYDVELHNPDTEFQRPVPGSAFATPTQTSNNQGYFLQEVLGFWDRLFLTGALRVEHNSNFGTDEDLIWAPRAGVSYLFDLGSRVTLKTRAAYGKSLRPPDPGEAGGAVSPTRVQRANPDLRPEVQQGFDVGFDLDVGDGLLTLETTYFNQTAEDLIDLTIFSLGDPQAGTPNVFQFQNIGEVTNRGIEVGLRSRWGLADLRASYTYASSEVNSLAEDYMGNLEVGDQLLYAPQHTAGGTLGLNLSLLARETGRPTRIEIGATYIGERTTEDQISFNACVFGLEECVDDTPSFRDYWVTLPSFVKLRAGVTQPVTNKLDLFVNVDNLLNRQESEFFPFAPSSGRAILIGLRFGE